MSAGVSLVQVSAAARCTPNTAARYEVAPDSVREDKRAALDEVYEHRLSELATRSVA